MPSPLLPQTSTRVPWLARLEAWALPSGITLAARDPACVEGVAVGMDAASCFAAEALDVRPGHDVLDLCCAPGLKLMALADMLERRGSLVGVDVSDARLDTAASLLRRFRSATAPSLSTSDEYAWNLCLVRADGRTFKPGIVGDGEGIVVKWSTARDTAFFSTHPNRRRAGRGLRRVLANAPEPKLPTSFDRVLVDAQCTHDASPRHRTTLMEAPWKQRRSAEGDRLILDAPKGEELEALQLALLANGFHLLKTGGYLVYATCSADPRQNEGIVSQLLANEPQARVAAIDTGCAPPAAACRTLPEALIFSPATSLTSGLFLAKIQRMA